MLIAIAWRNIWRNRSRSLIIIASVTIGLIAGIFILAFYNGLVEQRIRDAIETEVSHLQVHHPQFKNDYDIRFLIPSGRNMLQQVQHYPEVKTASGRVIIKGMVASAAGSNGITINGVLPETEQQLTGLNKKIREGSYFDGKRQDQVLISTTTARKLKLHLRSKAILTFQDASGNIASAAFRITGLYETINTPYDESNVFVPAAAIDSLAGIQGQLNEIAVILHENSTLQQVQHNIERQFPGTLVENWMQVSPELGLTVSVSNQMVLIFMGIILLALAFGITNTMLMAVLERTHELGMLKALGMNSRKLFGMILLETVFLVMAGCPWGIALALLLVTLTQHTGINLEQFADVYSSFGYSPVIYPKSDNGQLMIILVMVIATALLSALFPAIKAARLIPAASMRR